MSNLLLQDGFTTGKAFIYRGGVSSPELIKASGFSLLPFMRKYRLMLLPFMRSLRVGAATVYACICQALPQIFQLCYGEGL